MKIVRSILILIFPQYSQTVSGSFLCLQKRGSLQSPIHFNKPNQTDCGIAKLAIQNGANNVLENQKEISGSVNPQFGMSVAKQGSGTGLTLGTITDLDVTIKVDYVLLKKAYRWAEFTDQIGITPDEDLKKFVKIFDSGSILYEQDTYKAVGLIFAGAANSKGFANPIKNVLEDLS